LLEEVVVEEEEVSLSRSVHQSLPEEPPEDPPVELSESEELSSGLLGSLGSVG
jgi:hypothetical protein